AKLEYERNVALWEERKSRKKLEGDGKLPNGMDGVEPTNPLPPPTQHTMDDHDKEGEGDDGEDDKDKAPATRYRLNEAMRVECLSSSSHLEGSKELVSDQSQRKELYKKILQAFPDVSMMKKKMESLTGPKPEENRPAAIPA
ncbi:7155_t:CDS:2, partial [Acaulospora colombiana]